MNACHAAPVLVEPGRATSCTNNKDASPTQAVACQGNVPISLQITTYIGRPLTFMVTKLTPDVHCAQFWFSCFSAARTPATHVPQGMNKQCGEDTKGDITDQRGSKSSRPLDAAMRQLVIKRQDEKHAALDHHTILHIASFVSKKKTRPGRRRQ